MIYDFPGNSAEIESACSAGDPSLTPGLGRSPGEGIGYPLQYFGASMVPQMVKNLPEMQETWVGSPGWEDPLEEGMATHSSIPAWRIPMDRGASWATVHVVAKGWTKLSNLAQNSTCIVNPKLLVYPSLPCPSFPFGNHKFVFKVCESV